MKINPKIQWFDKTDKTIEEFDKLELQRFNIKNYATTDNYKLNNFYVFPVMDMDKESKTGYYAMCINKEFAKEVKQNLEAWQKTRK